MHFYGGWWLELSLYFLPGLILGLLKRWSQGLFVPLMVHILWNAYVYSGLIIYTFGWR